MRLHGTLQHGTNLPWWDPRWTPRHRMLANYRSASANQSRSRRRNTADIVSPRAAAFAVADHNLITGRSRAVTAVRAPGRSASCTSRLTARGRRTRGSPCTPALTPSGSPTLAPSWPSGF